ncbi:MULTISPECIES: histidine kinase dimerization/phospho-acceptor domain-containing protein [Blautia]|uniref:histidine kinase dimerization/phospho-acceptor domain-containing protein n=1 Tax=Blautia TaxID=572511 RepID=UPI000BA32B00|nr:MULTISPECIES: histidine kinase dimerization/phospho-acceptor domain-containing protein [Blautia]
MDIKLKNSRKLALVLVVLVILLPSLAMMIIRPHYIKGQGNSEPNFNTSSFMSTLTHSNYVLYAEEKQRENQAAMIPFDIFFPSALNDTQTKKNEESSNSGSKSNTSSQEISQETLDEENFPSSKYKDTFGDEYESYTSEEAVIASANEISSKFSRWEDNFSTLRSYLQYEVRDEDGKIVDSNATEELEPLLSGEKADALDKKYAFGAVIKYDGSGNVSQAEFFSGKASNATQLLNEQVRQNPCSEFDSQYGMDAPFQKPQGRTYLYLMTAENLATFLSSSPGSGYLEYLGVNTYQATDDLSIVFLTLLGMVAAAALLLPFIKQLQMGDEKIFQAPFELVCIIASFILGFSLSMSVDGSAMNKEPIYNVLHSIGVPQELASILQYFWGFIGWAFIFAVCYWAAGCLRCVFIIGPKRYIQERVIIYRIWPWAKSSIKNVYNSMLHVNLKDDTTKVLIKVVLINFIILGFISLMWVWGIGALIIYSIALFFLLRKYCNDLQKQYHRLLDATNQLADGNLNGTIPEELGVFEPFREEITKIQSGFKMAVDEEVKSQKMKTDLITNVSHDLKTPLTAIITYVDLLKDENLPDEERRRYIEVLEQKSTRLKLLIEDLFEISKATSRNVTLNIMDVDIVSLMQQAKLELQDKIEASNLYFRWRLPEEKVVLPLDSQKTYRVFENLLVNITKYAMPRTRVYVDMENDEKRVRISMKNISASELNFNPSEITERFVRGDVSRNTEGSGLGLAIAKSFVELQGGNLQIMVDADLFTVEIVFPKP